MLGSFIHFLKGSRLPQGYPKNYRTEAYTSMVLIQTEYKSLTWGRAESRYPQNRVRCQGGRSQTPSGAPPRPPSRLRSPNLISTRFFPSGFSLLHPFPLLTPAFSLSPLVCSVPCGQGPCLFFLTSSIVARVIFFIIRTQQVFTN